MSEVTQTFKIEDIPAPERLIGVDSLWEEDPTARTAYSDNPGFTDGTDAAHPIRSAQDSILARPEIAEALEQVHLVNNPRVQTLETPVRTELAVPGLAWLRENIGKESPILRTVKRQHNLLAPQEQRRQEMEAQKQESAAKHAAKRRARQAEDEAQRAHQVECDYQLDSALVEATQLYPDRNFDKVSQLIGKLSSRKEAGGELVIDEQKDFQKAIRHRVAAYMADPQELVEDFGALNEIGLAADGKTNEDFGIVGPYVTKIGGSLAAELSSSTYEDFNEEVMDKWLGLFDSQPSKTVPEDKLKEVAGSDLPENPVAFSFKILNNSLTALSRSDPRKFIHRLHALADKGLKPDNPAKFEMTFDILLNSLGQPLAHHELLRATSAALVLGNTEDELFNRAVDLTATLEAIGLFQLLPDVPSYNTFSASHMKIVDKICPGGFLTIGLPDMPANESRKDILKSTMKDFRAQALTPEGRLTTLYGNLADRGWLSQDPAAPGNRISRA